MKSSRQLAQGEKTSDPVRVYLREMGVVPLLTRESEVVIAKRLERGNTRVLKTVSRSAIVVKELIAVGVDLRSGHRSIKDIVQIDEEELTVEKIEEKTNERCASSTKSRICWLWHKSRPANWQTPAHPTSARTCGPNVACCAPEL